MAFLFPTPFCIIIPSNFFLKACAFECVKSSGSWGVAALDEGSLPKAPPAPSRSSP